MSVQADPQRRVGQSAANVLARELMRLGRSHDGKYRWHRESDPYVLLVAEVLLRRTTRTVVDRVLPGFLNAFPTVEDLASAAVDEVWDKLRPAGLRQRTALLPVMATAIAAIGRVPVDRDALLSLPGVGPYVADAVRLYAFSEPAFPMDRNLQRVFYRFFMGHEPRRQDPYRDEVLSGLVGRVTSGRDAGQLRRLHQGVMALAWGRCRPVPSCTSCDLRDTCSHGRGHDDRSHRRTPDSTG